MKSINEVEKWNYSRRLRLGTATDVAGFQIVVRDEYGHNKLCMIDRNVNFKEITDALPCQVSFKYTRNGYVITDWIQMER